MICMGKHYIYKQHIRISYYQHSFYARTIVDWNKLSPSVIESENINIFSNHLATKYSCTVIICMYVCNFLGVLFALWAHQHAVCPVLINK